MDTSANIEHSFEYAAEQAKENFQGDITSLLEAAHLIKSKIETAERNGKSGIYFSLLDAETLYTWLINKTSGMMGHYHILDGTNRKAMALFNAARKIEEKGRCSCKHLVAADKFLTAWEQYKQTKKVA